MTETKQLLERAERAFEPPTDVMDALVARRERKRRNERLQAGVLGLVIAIGLAWLGVSAIRSGPVPADPPPGSWSHVQLDPPVDGGAPPSFLAAGPDGLTAVGVDEGPATTWTSTDGATWIRTAAADLDGAHISDVTSGGDGFIALGDSGEAHAGWTSEDGGSWNRLPDPDFGDTLFISAVEPGGPGLVAVGSWMGAWYSSDGTTWERASVPPVPPGVYPGDDGNTPQIYLTDVADQGGRLVATGWAMLDDNSEVVVVWTSRDGRSWTDVPTQADVFPPGSSISDITAGPEGFVAVGRIYDSPVSTPAIWSSPDGRDWRLHRPGPDGLVLDSVAAGDGGYVAVGATMACDADCASREAVVMTSVDGDTWVRVPSGADFRVAEPSDPEDAQGAAMYDVVAWGSHFVALGEYDGEPTVWVTTPPAQEEPPAEDPGNEAGPVWPQTSLEAVRRAQELADGGDNRYTWQVSPGRWYQPGQNHPIGEEFFTRFFDEVLGWEDFLWTEAFAHRRGLESGDVVFVRCAPGTNPLYPDDPQGGTCAPTIDELRYETVRIHVAQLARQEERGLWVVTGWEMIEPAEQVAPPSDAELTTLMDAFLQARIDGSGAEAFADVGDDDSLAAERVDRAIPLLYATSTGASYERSEFELVSGPVWPGGGMQVKVRLFAENGTNVVEQVFSLDRDGKGRLRLVYDFEPTGPPGRRVLATTENGNAVPVEYGFLDGAVTFQATHPLAPSQDGYGRRDRLAIAGRLPDDDAPRRVLVFLADPRPIGPGCDAGPAPADAETLARSIRSDPDFETAPPVAVTIGGLSALQIDVVLEPGASSCSWSEPDVSSSSPLLLEHAPFGWLNRARLYLLDLPEGSGARVLAIATITDDDSFETVLGFATPIVDSIEFHAP